MTLINMKIYWELKIEKFSFINIIKWNKKILNSNINLVFVYTKLNKLIYHHICTACQKKIKINISSLF
jgi:hypothetical protein